MKNPHHHPKNFSQPQKPATKPLKNPQQNPSKTRNKTPQKPATKSLKNPQQLPFLQCIFIKTTSIERGTKGVSELWMGT
ncbi:MAG: hypothetical protein HDR81_05525 [Bacteroides sp.]|nr:hypothetical protein [Bacteroides sp.]